MRWINSVYRDILVGLFISIILTTGIFSIQHQRKFKDGQQVVMVGRNGDLGVISDYNTGTYTVHYCIDDKVYTAYCCEAELVPLSDDSLTTKQCQD